jgi:hypothetical protein
MEKQRKQPQQHLFADSQYLYSITFPPRIIAEQPNVEQPNYLICTATQTSWEQLNDIANKPYKNELSNSTDLTPVYTPTIQSTNTASTKQSITKKEEKPLLRTITSVQPNNDLMQKVYDASYTFVGSITFPTETQKCRDRQFSTLIHAINQGRVVGINEDSMGKFAYDNPSFFGHRLVNQYTIIFFNILKRYTSTVAQTKEPLPCDVKNSSSHKNLDHIFNLSPDTEIQNTIDACDTSSYCQQYSALNQVYHAIHSLDEYEHKTKDLYVSCLHKNHMILFEDWPQELYTDLKNELFNKLYYMAASDKIKSTDLYEILQIIQSAKNKQEIHNESDLGYAFLNFEPTGLLSYFGVDLLRTKQRIALFCKLVEQYNQKRCSKITPTDKQYSVYTMHSNLGLALPYSFNNAFFNENIYAFAEFEQLFKNTKAVMNANYDTVQQWVDKLYPTPIVK